MPRAADDIGRMRSIDEHSAEAYLRETGRIAPAERVDVRELTGGVSNMVLLVERDGGSGETFVLKQARAQLRTRLPWFSSLERNGREAEVLVICGRLLGTLHCESWLDPGIARALDDRALFEELRVDPYYRTLAEVHPELRPTVGRLIESLAEHRLSLVHADFSPNNLLVFSEGLMMVDFETGHYGDPAFDLGFFLSHLVLKACYNFPNHAAYLGLSETFSAAYRATLAPKIPPHELAGLWRRGVQNFAACAWARLDAKSPVEYLTDPRRRDQMRAVCGEILDRGPDDWPDVVALCRRVFDAT